MVIIRKLLEIKEEKQLYDIGGCLRKEKECQYI